MGEQADVIALEPHRAQRLLDKGLKQCDDGDVLGAVRYFRQSLDIRESTDGFIHLAKMMSLMGKLDLAIELCRKAISLDAEAGDAYIDIGTYYMKKKEPGMGVTWFEEAKYAARCRFRHNAYINLGNIYLSQGLHVRALAEFEGALKCDPGNADAMVAIARIQKILRK